VAIQLVGGSALDSKGTPTLPKERLDVARIRINYKIREREIWRTADSLLVDPSDPSEAERVAEKYMRKAYKAV
jgi:hypothetical protein